MIQIPGLGPILSDILAIRYKKTTLTGNQGAPRNQGYTNAFLSPAETLVNIVFVKQGCLFIVCDVRHLSR